MHTDGLCPLSLMLHSPGCCYDPVVVSHHPELILLELILILSELILSDLPLPGLLALSGGRPYLVAGNPHISP